MIIVWPKPVVEIYNIWHADLLCTLLCLIIIGR